MLYESGSVTYENWERWPLFRLLRANPNPDRDVGPVVALAVSVNVGPVHNHALAVKGDFLAR